MPSLILDSTAALFSSLRFNLRLEWSQPETMHSPMNYLAPVIIMSTDFTKTEPKFRFCLENSDKMRGDK